ncbi:MAG TPA: GNAT family N-acetyltransferase [Acidimicrobiia bacterium]|nr:GNAT family N-acetyltransferase [Acidimicrobiia bacterium]
MASDFEIRPVTPDEVEAFSRAPLAAFGETFDPDRFKLEWTHHELDRTLAAFDDGEIVGTGRLYSLELTLPGGALEPVAAVSWISVLPTHRRRGILTAIMGRELDDAVARGESMAVLHASEGVIYRRFGYGIAASSLSFTLPSRHTAFLRPPPEGGRVRLVDEETARKTFPEIFDRARRQRPGAVSRVAEWWANELFYVDKKEEGNRFFATYESADRALDGYVLYKVVPRWTDDGVSRHRLEVLDLVTASTEARTVLWRYLCDVDLVETIAAGSGPVDEPLRWLLADSRRFAVNRLSDGLWVRILDAATALAARRYAAHDRMVFDVVDEFRPDGAAAGRFALAAGPDGAQCERTAADPDLALAVADLGAAYLGGVTFSTLARAGLVEERTPGALARADAMFASDPAPYVMTEF